MGAVCSCFHVPDLQNNSGRNNSNSDDCYCLKCFCDELMNKHKLPFTEGHVHAITPSNNRASSSNSEVVFNISSGATGSHHGAASNNGNSSSRRQQKGTSRSRVQPEPVGQSDIKKPIPGEKVATISTEVGSQEQSCKPSTKVFTSTLPLPDHNENECPTCLEEYTEENPKIIAKCSHHFHLSCIYEWMERSSDCPACRELMLFDE